MGNQRPPPRNAPVYSIIHDHLSHLAVNFNWPRFLSVLSGPERHPLLLGPWVFIGADCSFLSARSAYYQGHKNGQYVHKVRLNKSPKWLLFRPFSMHAGNRRLIKMVCLKNLALIPCVWTGRFSFTLHSSHWFINASPLRETSAIWRPLAVDNTDLLFKCLNNTEMDSTFTPFHSAALCCKDCFAFYEFCSRETCLKPLYPQCRKDVYMKMYSDVQICHG